MRRNDLAVSVWRSRYDVSEEKRERLAEEAAILNADTSHLDDKRIKERVERVIRETDKAILVLTGHWRGATKEVWLPKSQVDFIEDGCNFVLIPVWLAKQKGYPVTIRTAVFD